MFLVIRANHKKGQKYEGEETSATRVPPAMMSGARGHGQQRHGDAIQRLPQTDGSDGA